MHRVIFIGALCFFAFSCSTMGPMEKKVDSAGTTFTDDKPVEEKIELHDKKAPEQDTIACSEMDKYAVRRLAINFETISNTASHSGYLTASS
ncbi:MAG: hypothetical protein JW969_08130 [Spirochaetales bacterium]|nr:hypothetical protein [Spirochaetales bacterium]